MKKKAYKYLSLAIFMFLSCGDDTSLDDPQKDSANNQGHNHNTTDSGATWVSEIPLIEPTPPCYTPAPLQEIPQDASEAWARQQTAISASNFRLGAACVARYSAIIDNMVENSSLNSWEHDYKGFMTETVAGIDRDTGEKLFRIDTTTVSADHESECPFGEIALGEYLGSWAYIELWSNPPTIILWSEQSVTVARNLGFAMIGVYHRGCDPKSGVSYGYLTNYDPFVGTYCWDDEGYFVSCDSVNTFPYASE